MKTVCCICKKLIRETDDEQDLVSYGMHEECFKKYYQGMDVLHLLSAV